MNPLPRHVEQATTWSSMLAWWWGREATAVITADDVVSGDELLAMAAGAASHLRSLTIHPGAVPALVTSNAVAIAYVIGGADSGRPLAPLGPQLTFRELRPCVERLSSEVVLTEPEFVPLAEELAAACDAEVVVLAGPPPPAASGLQLDATPNHTAFVLHTSGTTGVAKAVHYTQGRLAKRVRVNTGLCEFAPGCVYATASPFHHIAGFGNHAVALAAGAALAPMPRFSVDAWRGLAPLGVTHALTVPTMLEVLLDAGALALPDLRTLQYGASPIHPDTLRRTLKALPDVRLVNIYGQTEGSPVTVLTAEDHRRIAAEGRDDLLQSVGRAPVGAEVAIEGADADGIGEVVARGVHLFAVDTDGWLRTGDLGCLDDEGYLFLVGRRGDKIIRGGENVYPLEVEQVLEQHSGVAQAAVVGRPDRRWGETVVAFVVAVDPSAPPARDDLHEHARRELAGFKVPSEWRFVDELPRNASGKLLRRALLDATEVPSWTSR